MDRSLPWLVRVAWMSLAFLAGPALAAALDDHDTGIRTAASVGLWTAWSGVLLATLVLHPVSMTVLRSGAPAAVVAAVWAASTGAASTLAWATGVVASLLILLLVLSPFVGEVFVNGPAYPNERRMLLRPPGALLLGPIAIAWAAMVTGPAIGVLLLAGGQLVAGAGVAVVSLPLAAVLARALHGLSRRWLVFVPAGVVVHDLLALADPVLFPREKIRTIQPAPADTEAADLTLRTFGLAIEINLREPAPVARATRRRAAIAEAEVVGGLLVMATRPGAVMREATTRRLGGG